MRRLSRNMEEAAVRKLRRATLWRGVAAAILFAGCLRAAPPQATGSSGTVEVSVADPSGAALAGASISLSNKVSGFEKTAITDNGGNARFTNLPFNNYHVATTAPGFQAGEQDVDVRSSVPQMVKVTLQLAASTTTVEVHSNAGDLVESVPMAHTDISSTEFKQLPTMGVGQGVSDVLTLATPGVVQDSNGFFHPLGDHGETQFSVDNQPISDQLNKQASNQMPLNAIQSFEAISGAPPPEFGDKASLVVTTTTKSGMGLTRPTGSFSANYGSFGTYGEDFAFGMGTPKFGNFLVANSERSGRYLDTPEFSPIHAIGNEERIFDRVDFQASSKDTVHLNMFLARSWFQTPNTYDQQASGQDQREQVRTINIAPGWSHLFGPSMILNVNPFFRKDFVQYFPSANPFDDLPATISQNRRLTNAGGKADLSYVHGIHNAKAGVQITHEILDEGFNFAVTDPGFNAPCLGQDSNPLAGACPAFGAIPNPSFVPGLAPFDLTRGGRYFMFNGHADIKEYGIFAQDTVTLGSFTVTGGARGDMYYGLTSDSAIEPRIGVSYLIKPTATVIRASYSRFFETPYNENLLLSSSTGSGGLAASAYGQKPLTPGRRNQYQAGLQQGIGKYISIDANYFWKYTNNAFDFDALFNTPVAFPIEWRKSKIDGAEARVNLANLKGFTAYTAIGHTRARFFGPEVGGLIFNSPLSTGAFRIDHDEAFEQTTNVRYQYKKDGPWASFTWRYDSGQVAGSVPDLQAALALTADEQQAIGFYCGGMFATLGRPITQCASPTFGATRIVIPAPGTENDDTNPPRIAPRNVFDAGVGTDNLFRTDRVKWTLQLTAVNLTNKVALYNFLSTFSGTHFVTPRSYRAELGFVF